MDITGTAVLGTLVCCFNILVLDVAACVLLG